MPIANQPQKVSVYLQPLQPKYNGLVHKFRHTVIVLERMFTKFSEITQCDGHYAVQRHSRSPILVPIESSYTTSY